MVNKKMLFLFLGLFALVFLFSGFVSAAPAGSNVTVVNSSSSTISDVAGNDSALAGNVTEIIISAKTTTQSWQGYFGNITGTVQLADGSNNVMYNWSQASPRGEVYASTNSTIYWTNIQCFNFTATGNYTSETGNGGITNLYGTNLTQLQNRYNISLGDADAVNVTFNLLGAGTHNSFYTGNAGFTEGECPNTRIFDNTGAGVNDKFEQVLQYEPLSASVVFTSILNQDVLGFDGRTHDFQMLVLEDGHNGDVSTTPYYFFVELQ